MPKNIIALLIAAAILILPALASSPEIRAIDKKVGRALLDSVTTFFHEMAVSGSGGFEKVSPAFTKFISDARTAREKNQIDQVFFLRYKRILAIMGLAMVPFGDGIFNDILNQEFGRFVRDVLGEEFDTGKNGTEAIRQLAAAVSEEIINLHLYLNDVEAKEKLRKSFEGKFLDTAPKGNSDRK